MTRGKRTPPEQPRAPVQHYIHFTPEKEQRFLELLAAGNTVVHACRESGVEYRTAYAHRAASPEFAVAWDEASQIGIQVMEQEAFRRAVHGVTKPLLYQGEVVTMVQEYSDSLLMFLLKARRPHIYRDTVNVEQFIRQAAIAAGVDPDAAVIEAQALLSAAKSET